MSLLCKKRNFICISFESNLFYFLMLRLSYTHSLTLAFFCSVASPFQQFPVDVRKLVYFVAGKRRLKDVVRRQWKLVPPLSFLFLLNDNT